MVERSLPDLCTEPEETVLSIRSQLVGGFDLHNLSTNLVSPIVGRVDKGPPHKSFDIDHWHGGSFNLGFSQEEKQALRL
jgi:hypothetical protein